MIEVYKIVSGMEKMDRGSMFTMVSKYKYWGHQMKLVGASFRTNT